MDQHASMLGTSKSQRLAAALESEIRAGKVARGDLLASENALVRRFLGQPETRCARGWRSWPAKGSSPREPA